MSQITHFLKRHTLLAAFAAVLAPLAVLLALQFLWLDKLQRVSAIAHKASLNTYLETVGLEVQYFYRTGAERALNLPAALFTQGRLETAAYNWDRRPVEGARRLFLVDFTREEFGNFLVYNPDTHTLETPPASDEALAIIMAAAPWQLLNSRGVPPGSVGLTVDERNPEYRMILNPITDDASDTARVVGIAGMILDERYFKTKLLPLAVERAIPGFFPDLVRDDLIISVRDSKDNVVLATRSGYEEGNPVTRNFPFVFTDWSLNLHSSGSSPEQLARAGFALNLALSIVLALVLVGGVVMALRAADRSLKLSQMKSDFVSNVSHELRTPLASIRVFAEFLRLGRALNTERVQEYGDYIEAESRRLSRLIDNILDFSRIESGRKTYNFVPADLEEVVTATLKTFEVRLKHSGFRVAFEKPASRLGRIEIDSDAIAQALNNLLDNAVKYSGDSRDIHVRLFADENWVAVSVRDRGIGIARDEQKKIFERFHRVGTGLVHDVKGSGLGLSIVNHIVEAHGGRVGVDSEPGQGSTFTIQLPIRPVRDRREAEGTDESVTQGSRLQFDPGA